ncbi:MAG: class I mannose-6-phosphate isomerase [Acidimicrobiia bacterium]|nr:class I mannose-6-phosphate isomerase [Acidimicrobiia bacterium]
MTDLSPLIMSPVLAVKPWGGRRLSDYGKDLPKGEWIGESWEVADLPAAAVTTVSDPRSRVAAGPNAGKTLRDLIDEFGADLLGSAPPTPEGGFPLLVKLLDAREHLSVQVHPDAEYVAAHPEARLKAESWYVVEAAPNSHLYLGLREGTTPEDLASRAGTAATAGVLNRTPARAGDFHHLPAGLVHALGAGVLVAEVQTPSDTTFRIYDWEDRYRRPHRQMHIHEALEAVRPDLTSQPDPRPETPGTRELVKSTHYWIREHRGSGEFIELDQRDELRVLMAVTGGASLNNETHPVGTTVVIPAAVAARAEVELDHGSVLLEIGLGSAE